MNSSLKAPHLIIAALSPVAGVFALILLGAGSLPT
jgi:hypothetical protein